MKTLPYQITALILGCALLASCGSNRSDGEPMPKVTSLSTSLLQLKLASPNSVTLRAVSETDPLQRIRNLRFVFYSGSEGAEVVSQIKTKVITSASDLQSITLALPSGNYKLVVIGNASTEAIQATQLGAPLSRLTENKTHAMKDFLYYNEHPEGGIFDGICMLNDQGAINITPQNFQAQTSTPAPTPLPEIHLEGTLARILVYGIPTSNGGNTLQKADLGFNVLNQSTSPSWLRQLGNSLESGNPIETTSTPVAQRYASGLLTGTDTPNDLNTKVSYKYVAEPGFSGIFENLTDNHSEALMNASYYAKESVVGANNYLQATAPCVLLRVKYIPQGLRLTENEGWLNIKGNYHTESQVKSWIQTNKYPSEGIKEAIEQAQITTNSFTKEFEQQGIKFYYKSYNYYTIYIRHFNDQQAPNANSYGRYGIVRNNEYRIQLQRISGEGSPVQPNLQTALTPIQESQQLKVAISVNPISQREQVVEL